MACYVGQLVPFDEGSELLSKLSAIDLSDKMIENISHHYGQLLEETYGNSEAFTVKDTGKEPHYVMLDGSMIYTREEGWKEIKLGRVFSCEDSLSLKNRQELRRSEYLAHLGKSSDFLSKMETLMDSYDNLIAVADGATWIWNYFDTYRPEVTQILDFYHAIEKLANFAEDYFGKARKAERIAWFEKQKNLLKQDKVLQVIENIKDLTCKGKAKISQKALLSYYQNNQQRMKYKTFKEQGYLIGSGAIEAAHRNVIQQRLKLSGQRWTKKGAQQIVNLRAVNKSQKWNKVIKLIKYKKVA